MSGGYACADRSLADYAKPWQSGITQQHPVTAYKLPEKPETVGRGNARVSSPEFHAHITVLLWHSRNRMTFP